MKRQYNIKNDEGVLLGTVEIDVGSAALDLALTPIVNISKDARPEVTGFLASRRVELDTRARMEEWPYCHLNRVFGGTRPDDKELEEMEGV